MVYYKEVPEVNKRMVAGYYLFLCLIGFAILLGPTGSGIPITLVGTSDRDTHEALLAQPGWGDDPASCDGAAPCHGDRYGNWSMTGHATAAWWNATSGHIVIGEIEMGFNAYNNTVGQDNLFNDTYCVECHTTGYNATDGSYDFLGVNCFSCHNISAAEWVDYSGATCGTTCHSGDLLSDHPQQFGVWNRSVHANSLTDLRSSDHAATYCMHCQATEAFIEHQNPGELATSSPAVNGTRLSSGAFPVDGPYTSISCPACHAVHSSWVEDGSPAYIRAVNATELCGVCHVGDHHPMYTVWLGGPHNLAGVECTDCHGYDLTVASGDPFMNHTFVVKPDIACGQEECHDAEGAEEWALGQLEMIEDAFEALTHEIHTEATALQAIIDAYNATEGADHAVANHVADIIEEVEDVVHLYEADRSMGFHYPHMIFEELNAAFVDLVDAKAYFYENTDTGPTVTVTVTVTNTVTGTPPPPAGDTLLLIGGSVGGIVVGLVLGILVGRRR